MLANVNRSLCSMNRATFSSVSLFSSVSADCRGIYCALCDRSRRPTICHRRNYSHQVEASTPDSSTPPEQIIIPKRIHRGPTDILKALASTIKRDPTAAHYKFHDDPYLIPLSNNAKRIYALSQESGRKTAMWVRERHPELFQHRKADPPIEAFYPKFVYDETDVLDNDILAKIILSSSIDDAIHVYKLMLKTGVDVSPENKQNLLELVCFFNETEQLAEQLVEERWFAQSSDEKTVLKKTWKDGGFAEKLFEELPRSDKTYSAIIQGMVKYHQMAKANEYFQEATDQNIVLSQDAYHAILRTANYVKHSSDLRWKFVEDMLHRMNDDGYTPNIRTLNTVLAVLDSMSPPARDARLFALKMIAEVRRFGVEPSLGSYHFLLNIFCNDKENKTRCHILEDILDHIQGREFQIRDSWDTSFFLNAMKICRYHLYDINVAYRVNDLLWFGKNYNLIGNSYREAAYYRYFFTLLINSEDFDTIMKLYNHYVPNIYTPELSVMEELVNVVTMNGAVEHYPRIWTDVVQFEMYDKGKILEPLLNGMALNRPRLSIPPSEKALQLGETVWSIFLKATNLSKVKTPLEWTGNMLGNIMVLCVEAGHGDRAMEVLNKLKKDESVILGVPDLKLIESVIDACVLTNNDRLALMCLDYCDHNGYDYDVIQLMARKVAKGLQLNAANKAHLIALAGQDIFKEVETDDECKDKQTATNS